MNWIDKLERKFGRHGGITNLTVYIIICYVIGYLLTYMNPSLLSMMSLDVSKILQGQIWRLVTFIFVPTNFSPFWLLISLFFYYFIGSTLEREWGTAKFNIYYFGGLVLTLIAVVAASLITGVSWTLSSTYYINMSMFFAFAMLYPDFQVLLFFIIPIKMKYMALFSGALCLIDLLMGGWSTRAAVLLSLANFLLFFGGDFFRTVKQEIKYHKTRRTWQNQNRSNWR